VEYEWLRGRFASEKLMQTPGIPSTRWFDSVLLPKDQIEQPDRCKAMFVMGHGGNTVTRMPEMVKGLEALELMVVADPHPTTYAQISNRRDNTYLLPICTNFETVGSRTASNRSLQWGEKIVEPLFESRNDYDAMYVLAKRLGFADEMFKNIAVRDGAVVVEDILREINRGTWSLGYTGQSPERLRAHMRHQQHFDVTTLRAGPDAPEEVRALALLGHARDAPPGLRRAVRYLAACEGWRRRVPCPLRGGTQRRDPIGRGQLVQGFRDRGWLPGVHRRNAETPRLVRGAFAA
jgi:formate dehydrogenase major subunit